MHMGSEIPSSFYTLFPPNYHIGRNLLWLTETDKQVEKYLHTARLSLCMPGTAWLALLHITAVSGQGSPHRDGHCNKA